MAVRRTVEVVLHKAQLAVVMHHMVRLARRRSPVVDNRIVGSSEDILDCTLVADAAVVDHPAGSLVAFILCHERCFHFT